MNALKKSLLISLSMLSLLSLGCATSLETYHKQGGLVKIEEGRSPAPAKYAHSVEIDLDPGTKCLSVQTTKAPIYKKRKRKLYQKVECKRKVKGSLFSDKGSGLDGIMNSLVAIEWGIATLPFQIIKAYSDSKESGKCYDTNELIAGEWKDADEYVSGKTYQIAANQRVRIRIPELGYSGNIRTGHDGKGSLNLLEIFHDRKYRKGIHIIAENMTEESYCETVRKMSSEDLEAFLHVAGKPPKLECAVSFSDENGNGVLEAGEKSALLFRVTNTGEGDAFGVALHLGSLTTDEGVSFPKEFKMGHLRPGQSIHTEIPISCSENIPAGTFRLVTRCKEYYGFDAPEVKIAINKEEFREPDLTLGRISFDDTSHDGAIEPGEIVQATVEIKNHGAGKAQHVTVELIPGENVFLANFSKKQFHLGDLMPEATRNIDFSFYTNNRIKHGEIPIELKITEKHPRFCKNLKLRNLTMHASQDRSLEVVIAPKGEKSNGSARRPDRVSEIDVDKDLPKTRIANPNAFSVVIGNSKYEKTKKVDYAINDAQALKRYLTDVIGYKEGNIFVLEDCKKSDFELFFGTSNHRGKLSDVILPGQSDVFIYYSGHGAPGLKDRQVYLMPVEADPHYLELQGYPIQLFYENLKTLQARSLTVVMDSCFSGSNVFGSISGSVEISNVLLESPKSVILTSSKNNQVSCWYDDKRHGMFTYFFLKAIHNKNADMNGDGRLTFDELYAYISDNSKGIPYYARKLYGVEQTPIIEGDYKGKVFITY